jgi:outer membrane receptor for ferric coprogen and ferric-rhodotorulic acid
MPSIQTHKLTRLAASIAVLLAPVAGMAAENSGVEEILVLGSYTVGDSIDTATGLGLTLRETPQSVSIMTEQRIQDLALDTIADVVMNTVGVSINEVDNVRNTFNSRGFEINNYQIDGVTLSWSLAGTAGETIADVSIYERIEVVRGATGLLTGAGDPSASINLVRKHADSTEFAGYLNASSGRWNNRQFMADGGSGLNSTGSVRGRVVAKYEEGDSFMDLYQDSRKVFYGVLEADIGPATLLRAGASYQNNDPTAPTWGALPSWYADGSSTDWDRSKTSSAEWTHWETTNENYFASLVHTFSNDWRMTFNINRLESSEDTLLLYLSGNPDRTTGLGMSSYPYNSDGASKQDSFDLQLKGDYALFGRQHEFVVGALHSEQTSTNTSFSALAFPPATDFNIWDGSFQQPDWSPTGTLEVDLETEQTGTYAATRLNITDALKVIVGGRASSWERTGVNYGVNSDFGDSGVFVPYAGALYDLNESHRLYASYTEIFMPQNAQDRNGDYLDAMVGKSSEVGLKSTFFDEALQTSVAYFIIEQDNLAQPDPGFLIPGTIFDASRAAQGTESKGYEFEVVGEPFQGWNLGFGYTDFRAEDADGAAVNTDHPRKLLTLFTTYRFDDYLPGLVIGGGVNWRSENYSESTNPVTGQPQRLEQEAYSLVNLMASYNISDQLHLQLNIDNLFDKKYYSQVGFYEQYRYGTPRNYNLGLTYQF